MNPKIERNHVHKFGLSIKDFIWGLHGSNGNYSNSFSTEYAFFLIKFSNIQRWNKQSLSLFRGKKVKGITSLEHQSNRLTFTKRPTNENQVYALPFIIFRSLVNGCKVIGCFNNYSASVKSWFKLTITGALGCDIRAYVCNNVTS